MYIFQIQFIFIYIYITENVDFSSNRLDREQKKNENENFQTNKTSATPHTYTIHITTIDTVRAFRFISHR